MIRKHLASACLFAIVSSAAPLPAGAAESVSLAFGSTVANHIKKLRPGFEQSSDSRLAPLKEDGMGSDSVVVAVDSGKVDVGILGSPWEEVVKVLEEKKIEVKNLPEIRNKVVGKDKVVFITHKSGPKELTKEQIRAVLTGTAANWNVVGGPDAPVQIVIQANTPVTQKLISSQLLEGKDLYRRGIKILPTYDEVAKYVASNKGAIGFGPPSMGGADVTVLTKPEIEKPFIVITVGEPTERVQKLIDYMVSNQPK